jgi:glutamate N-acetyltransferase/amino-acid N-acetyltransferase
MSNTPENSRIGVCRPQGYSAAGVACGIKSSNIKDLAVVYSDTPAAAAGVFTTNRVKAAPVVISQEHIADGKAQAVVISSGNANAATGPEGVQTAQAMCRVCADALSLSSDDVLIAQTGLIGIPLRREVALSGVVKAAKQLSPAGGELAAQAIMTTDTKPRLAHSSIDTDEGTILIGAMAKGAAMLAPSMATMLACITTDAKVTPNLLRSALVVDGNMSTNDTVFVLANGASGTPEISDEQDPRYVLLVKAIAEVCKDLAMQMVADAEGASKMLIMEVQGAQSKEDAFKAAHRVAGSILVKCSLSGGDAYWGRVLADLGSSGAEFNPAKVSISYGREMVCENGYARAHDKDYIANYLESKVIHITANLHNGDQSFTAFGCDLTHAYVDENMGTS